MSRNTSDTTAREHLWLALQQLVGEGALRKRLTHTINPLLRVAGAETSEPIKSQAKALSEELMRTEVMINDYYPPRRHISAKRAKQIANEILDLYTNAMGGL